MFMFSELKVLSLSFIMTSTTPHVFHTNFSGKKRWYLFPKDQGKYLYAHPFTVRSYVDPVNPDFEKFPHDEKARGYYVELEPGDTLFIPAGYWHHVVYDSPSYALSRWIDVLIISYQCEFTEFSIFLFAQMLDRFVNKLNSRMAEWKEKKADLVARRT